MRIVDYLQEKLRAERLTNGLTLTRGCRRWLQGSIVVVASGFIAGCAPIGDLPQGVSRTIDAAATTSSGQLRSIGLTTSSADAWPSAKWLNIADPKSYRKPSAVPRVDARGKFPLKPGYYAHVAQSYCLKAGTLRLNAGMVMRWRRSRGYAQT